jgi:phosphonate transport system permease protein
MASGGNWFQMIRYAVVPQVFPNFMSYTLLRFEINVRAASVVGFVGAGGIGQELMTSIRQFLYTDVSAIVLMLVCAVTIIDVSCEKIRHRIIGQEILV